MAKDDFSSLRNREESLYVIMGDGTIVFLSEGNPSLSDSYIGFFKLEE